MNSKCITRIPRRTFIAVVMAALFFLSIHAESFAKPQVQIWLEPLVIPTYTVDKPDPNPRFYAGRGYQGAQGRIYPDFMSDVLTNRREDKTYNAVYLENQYLKICVLPEIGGRIFSAMDKTNNYDFFYHQHVIKPAPIGMLGEWISGGVEWNFPHHHRARTFMPMDYEIVNNQDGSKTLWMGELEYRHRMRFLLGITLYPDKSYLEVTVKIVNGTPFVHSFLYWANPAVHVDDTYQVIFSPQTQFVTQHAKNEFSEWPISNSRYGNQQYKNVDISWWKNLPKPVSFFCWDESADFFAGYNHGKNAGVVYVADHHLSPGKKFFTFGCGDEGKMWDKMLTDNDGSYLELMAGAFSDNQPDYSWIQPYEVKIVKQYWFPIRDTEGLKYANINAALNLQLVSDTSVNIRINTTSDLKNADITLHAGEKLLYETQIAIRPDLPFRVNVNLPAGTKEQDLMLTLRCGKTTIAQYQPPVHEESPPFPQPVIPPGAPKTIKTNEELYLAGLRLDQFYNSKLNPSAYYEEAIKRDPDDSRVNTQLGILYCKRGLFSKAEQHLNTALARLTHNYTRPKTGEAYYYLGVALKGQGKYQLAYDVFSKASWDSAWHSASYYALAELDCWDGQYEKAIEHINRAVATNSLNTNILNLKTTVLRKLGRYATAQENAQYTLKIDPLDGRAKNELHLIRADQKAGRTNRRMKNIEQSLSCDLQTCIEIAVNYGNSGFYREAIDILSTLKEKYSYPMVYYYLGFYNLLNGDRDQSRKDFRIAAETPSDYCFPFRLESIKVLQTAISDNPKDSRAHYYLGNLWYDKEPEYALEHWQIACALDATTPTAHRNLAFAYWQVRNDIPNAIKAIENAISINPNDPRLYYELDVLYEAARVPVEKRLEILEKNDATISKRDDALARKALLYVQTSRYEEAYNLLTTHHFNTWEGGGQIHDIYVDACLLYGRQQYINNELPKALELHQAALEYPDNLEVGRPLNDESAVKPLYLLGLLHENSGQPQDAQDCYQKAVSIEVDLDEPMYYQALALLKSGDQEKALGLFARLIDEGRRILLRENEDDFFAKFGEKQSQDQKNAHAHYLVGLGLLGQNQTEAARKEFQKVVELDICHIWAKIQLDELKDPAGQTQMAPLFDPLTIQRKIPVPLPDHPGNIFLDNEEVVIGLPANLPVSAVHWQALDEVDRIVISGSIKNNDTVSSIIKIGTPGIGWYKIEFLDSDHKVLDFTTAAVLSKLAQPTPQDSPICVDAAISWLAKDPIHQEQLANIASLAGINWIRDRIRWNDIQPERETFSERGDYQNAAEIQNRNGLKVLQVFHDTPQWAAGDQNQHRFPQDLRIVYDSCRQLGVKFKNWVQAWEPWNEANAANFGGHTMAQMCSYQKAAYLGFKAGNPDIIVGWNPYGGLGTEHHTNGVLENETWPYFDTYNTHSYHWPGSYFDLFAPVRKAACGKPIWLTESDRGMHSTGNSPWYDLSPENNLLKAQFIAQSYASSLHSGMDRHFHFILEHYTEGSEDQPEIQFGLLRKDLTPRPSYVALAATGRFLAGARCLGRYRLPENPDCHVYAFQAKPDGQDREVIVAWAEISGDWPSRGKCRIPWPLPNLEIEASYDYLGRPVGKTVPEVLTSAPIFIILPAEETTKLPLEKPEQYNSRPGEPSEIVLQISMPEAIKIIQDANAPWIIEPQYMIHPGQETQFHFFAYNFSSKPVEGAITLEKFPENWTISPACWEMHLEPMERKSFTATLMAPVDGSDSKDSDWFKLVGAFSSTGRTALAFYVTANSVEPAPYVIVKHP